MNRRRTHAWAPLVALMVFATGCAGAEVDQSATESEPHQIPEVVDDNPDEVGDLAFVATDLNVAGPTALNVVAGETLTVAHALRNPGKVRTSAGLVLRSTEDKFALESSITSVRLEPGEALGFTVEVSVPDDAQVGDTATYKLTAGTTGGAEPAVHTVALTVVKAGGERPTVGSAAASTTTNERVSVYVLGSAADADGDLDQASLRIVWGGFVSDEVTAANGTVTYVPFNDVVGTDAVIYEICDDEQLCATAVAHIEITAET